MTSEKQSSRTSSLGRLLVWVTDEIDLAAAPRLRLALERAAPQPGERVVVDLSGVTFIDCSGLSPLLEAETRLGDRLLLRGVPPRVTTLLRLAGLQSRFGTAAAPGERAAGALVGGKPPDDAPSGILELEEEVASQRARVSGRARIDQAKGLVMATHNCDAEQAWQLLFRASRTQGVQVHDLAEALAESAAGRDMDQSSAAMRAAVLAVMTPGGEVPDDDPRPGSPPTSAGPGVHHSADRAEAN